MNSKEKVIVNGLVTEALSNAIFRVKIESEREPSQQDEILAYLSGRMRIHRIKVLVGDKIKVELNPYDKARGRIVQRL